MTDINDWSLADKDQLFSYLNGSSYCSKQYKLLYVSTPKVACTTLKWWFAELEGYAQTLRQVTSSAESDPDLIIHDSFHKIAPDVTGLTLEALLEPLTSESYFRFAVVRNPYKRIFSAWQSKLLLQEPLQIQPYRKYDFFNQPIESVNDIAIAFENFLQHLVTNEAPHYWDVHWTPQAILLRPDLINYSKLVKIENVKELSIELSNWLGTQFVDPFASRSANESLIPYLPEFVTPKSSELIRLLYSKDFEMFGYSKQPPEAKEIFSAEQLKLALKAIQIIRGRHQRLGEMSLQIPQLSQALVERDRVISEQDGEIKRLYGSYSWRLTRPLRFFAQLIREPRLFFAQFHK